MQSLVTLGERLFFAALCLFDVALLNVKHVLILPFFGMSVMINQNGIYLEPSRTLKVKSNGAVVLYTYDFLLVFIRNIDLTRLLYTAPRSTVIRESARGAAGRGLIPDRVTPKTLKMGGLRFSAWRLALMS